MQKWADAVRDLGTAEQPLSRDAQLERARRAEALQCVGDAIQRHLSCPVPVSDPSSTPRVLVAHRLGWFADRIADAFRQRGLIVVAQLSNGAEALGAAIAEQPDLLVLEDAMVRLPAEAVLAELCRYAPRTVVAVQVEGPDRAHALHVLGAQAPFARNLPPAQVVGCLVDVLAAARHCRPADEGRRVDLG